MKKRSRIFLSFIAIAGALVWLSDEPPPQAASNASPVQDLLQVGYAELANTSPLVQLGSYDGTGIISLIYGDTLNFTEDYAHAYLSADDGQLYNLHNMSLEALQAFNGEHVRLVGMLLASEGDLGGSIEVAFVEESPYGDAADSVEGNQKWVNVACRFGDMTEETPQPLEYFRDMMSNSQPGMDHYWRQTSARLVDIAGSQAYAWYNLPQSKAYYERVALLNTGMALQMLMKHCTDAAIAQDNVDFAQFAGINIMLNDTFGCCAWGGRMPLTVNGKQISFRTTWLPPWAFNSLHVIGHEMGHGWGLPHSSGPYGEVYDSAWDVMSGGTRVLDFCPISIENIGCYQVGTIGYHLEMLGWIPDSRVVTVNGGQSATVTLDALTTILSGVDNLLVRVPIGATGNFYTVEVRNFVAYDRNLPGEAVVLHEVQPNRSSPAHVVDSDDNGNPNDEGAMWLVGETFTDSASGITVEVLSRLGTTFTVRVTNR